MNGLSEETPKHIKKWGCHKLEAFADYIAAWLKTYGADRPVYLEPYAGGGSCLCQGTSCVIADSARRALGAGFAGYIFITGDDRDADSLGCLAPAEGKVSVIKGSPISDRVLREAFDLVPRSAPSLAFIDPPGYSRLRLSTIRKLAEHGRDWRGNKTELLIVFPLEMALLRNLTRPDCQLSITRLYGNQRWLEIRQARLEGKITADETRRRLVALYKEGLKALGYRHVTDFRPTYYSRLVPYHVISCSDRGNRGKLLEAAWGRQRYLPCELLYTRENDE